MSSASTASEARRLRQRARLLEFLKFRVLASQEAFFEAWRLPAQGEAPVAGACGSPPLDPQAFRLWLQPLWPAAAELADDDLLDCLAQAHDLYVDASPIRR